MQKGTCKNVFSGSRDHFQQVWVQKGTCKNVFAGSRDQFQQVQVQKVTGKNVFIGVRTTSSKYAYKNVFAKGGKEHTAQVRNGHVTQTGCARHRTVQQNKYKYCTNTNCRSHQGPKVIVPPPPCISYANVPNYYGPYAHCSLDTCVACAQHIQLPTHTCARAWYECTLTSTHIPSVCKHKEALGT